MQSRAEPSIIHSVLRTISRTQSWRQPIKRGSTMIQISCPFAIRIVPFLKEDMLEEGRWKHDKVKRSKLVLTFDLTLLPFWVIHLQSASIELNKIEAVPTNKNRKGVCVRRRKIETWHRKTRYFLPSYGAASLPSSSSPLIAAFEDRMHL